MTRPSEVGVPGGAGVPSRTAAPFTVEHVGAAGDPHGPAGDPHGPAGDLHGPAGDLHGPTGLVRLHFFVPRRSVSYTRFILEGYDHLGVQSSEPGSSHVIWTVPAALRADAEQLLADLLTRLK